MISDSTEWYIFRELTCLWNKMGKNYSCPREVQMHGVWLCSGFVICQLSFVGTTFSRILFPEYFWDRVYNVEKLSKIWRERWSCSCFYALKFRARCSAYIRSHVVVASSPWQGDHPACSSSSHRLSPSAFQSPGLSSHAAPPWWRVWHQSVASLGLEVVGGRCSVIVVKFRSWISRK